MKKLLFMLLLVTLFSCKKSNDNTPTYTIDINTPKFTTEQLNRDNGILCDIRMDMYDGASFYTMGSEGITLLASTELNYYDIKYKPTFKTVRHAILNKTTTYYIQVKDSTLDVSISNKTCRVYYMNVNGVNHTFIRLQNNISMDGYQQHEKYIIEAFLKIPNVSYK